MNREIKILLNMVLMIALLIFSSSLLFAQSIPQYINYQGRLADQVSGAPINGVKSITFSLYNTPLEGTPIYSQTKEVNITNGVFSVYLGQGEGNYNGNAIVDGIPIEVFTEHSARYIGIKIKDSQTEMSPRQLISSVAYSFQTAKAKEAENVMGQVIVDRSSGNVGIGTINPSENLEVTGNIKVSNTVKAMSFEGINTKLSGNLEVSGTIQGAELVLPLEKEGCTNDMCYLVIDDTLIVYGERGTTGGGTSHYWSCWFGKSFKDTNYYLTTKFTNGCSLASKLTERLLCEKPSPDTSCNVEIYAIGKWR